MLLLSTSSEARDSARPLFESDSTLDVTLEAPWSELVRSKDRERRDLAILGVTDGSGRAHRLEATVEVRGLTRLQLCGFPPLRIRMARNAADGSVFAGQRELKMVTHCRSGNVYEQYYVQELLAYRIYNLVTPHSFRVRSLTITYLDTRGGAPDGPHFAFLIEDVGDMARRNGHKRSSKVEFAPGDFDPALMTRFMLFQYLIGNTDFEVLSGPRKDACCHNVRVTGAPDGSALVAVPYDLDSAGMIDASYAAPLQRLPIKSVTDRLFRGFCSHNEQLEPVRAEFLGNRDAILALVHAEGRLSAARKRETLRYFEAFFTTLGSKATFAREVSGKCRR